MSLFDWGDSRSTKGTEEESFFPSMGSEANIASTVIGAVTPNDSVCPSLSFQQRIIGFLVAAGLGIIMSIVGTIMLIFGSIIPFAVLYSLGNICTLCSSGFLIGPMRQIQQMIDPTRIAATLVFFLALGATLAVAFSPMENKALCILFVIIQFFAFAWYSISYIPFAREAIIKLVSTIFEGL